MEKLQDKEQQKERREHSKQELLINLKSEEVLVENIWDLFYDALADFLVILSIVLNQQGEKNQAESLTKASHHISKAWTICSPFMQESTNSKHQTKIEGISHQELAIQLQKKGDLKEFLTKLSQKIHRDSLADRARGRTQLADQLEACSKALAEAGK